MAFTATDPIKMIFAVILPPLGVFFEVGFKGHFWLNIILTWISHSTSASTALRL
ncbi:YqaE/Pmp3 family membrane protein [Vreelandella glaciei]|uniref:YqaE/Pmp3 family membrane protein n=1 Tax=Vreelandella glaciei TaxID=186761 RepID=UPI0030ED094C